jgi:predicted nucleic acid-binding protein
MAAELAQRRPLKAYDAVQLAVALRQERALMTVKRSLVFISGDRSLVAAASVEGIAVDTPFDHLSPEDLHSQGPRS